MSLLRTVPAAVLLALLTASAAHAQSSEGAPAAGTGFQMALRTGYGIPMGKSSGEADDRYSDFVSGQVPIMLDLGGKLSPHVFLGAYLGLGFGGAGDGLDGACTMPGVDCAHGSFRLGAQLQYNVRPEEKVNPWLGYGIGIESSGVVVSNSGQEASVAAAGFELARLMAGVDFRLSHAVGIGPYMDFTLGRYSRMSMKSANGSETSGDIERKAMHEWLTFGVRFVLFP